jgi:hypothetical protein
MAKYINKMIKKFPSDTLFNEIYPDLLNVINEYLNISFTVGLKNDVYPNYRPITQDEFDASKTLFLSFYFMNNGLSNAINKESKIGYITVENNGITFNNDILIANSISSESPIKIYGEYNSLQRNDTIHLAKIPEYKKRDLAFVILIPIK